MNDDQLRADLARLSAEMHSEQEKQRNLAREATDLAIKAEGRKMTAGELELAFVLCGRPVIAMAPVRRKRVRAG